MKTIPLTKGKVTLVDDAVYEWACYFKWYAQKSDDRFYAARRTSKKFRKSRLILLHREILCPGPKLDVDHKDGDTLNNLGKNLRPATRQQNMRASRKPWANKSSKYRGVRKHSDGGWTAQATIVGKQHYLGYFDVEENAARAYDKFAVENYGEFAHPNFSL